MVVSEGSEAVEGLETRSTDPEGSESAVGTPYGSTGGGNVSAEAAGGEVEAALAGGSIPIVEGEN